MTTPKSPLGTARKGGRMQIPRRLTKGPLDTQDPLNPSEHDQFEASDPLPQATSSILSQLTFLQNPRLYHQIPKDNGLRAFLDSKHQPPISTALVRLLQFGHYRRAAETALTELLRVPSLEVLQLLYIRLGCLVIIGQLELAADEAAPLVDYLNSSANDVVEIIDLVPWPLRLLLAQLQVVSAQDGGRRAIMTLYSLASEVRAHIRECKASGDDTGLGLWTTRLTDLRLRVSDTMVEIGELETADRHLDTLKDNVTDEILIRKAMLGLRSGDIQKAAQLVVQISDDNARGLCNALLTSVEWGSTEALKAWQSLSGSVAAQNEAVYLLYDGQIDQAMQKLDDLVSKGQVYHTVLFNLSTIYELCSEKATSRKLNLAERLSSIPSIGSTTAWERSTVDLKI